MELKPKDQIVYLPYHTKGDIGHPDAEFGFVMSITESGSSAFCRYWIKKEPGVLRTVANSESTPISMLRRVNSVDSKHVEKVYNDIKKHPEKYGHTY